MAKIITKRRLNPTVTLMEVSAPLIAKKALPGQFIILRVDEKGERIPLTIADYDRRRARLQLSSRRWASPPSSWDSLEEGDDILDFVGPLGRPTELEGVQKVAVVGGGVGCAIAYPQAKYPP